MSRLSLQRTANSNSVLQEQPFPLFMFPSNLEPTPAPTKINKYKNKNIWEFLPNYTPKDLAAENQNTMFKPLFIHKKQLPLGIRSAGGPRFGLWGWLWDLSSAFPWGCLHRDSGCSFSHGVSRTECSALRNFSSSVGLSCCWGLWGGHCSSQCLETL